MLSLLAIIGLFFLLFIVFRGLKKAGKWLEAFGDGMINYASSLDKKTAVDNSKEIKKLKDKINKIKGEYTDDEFYSRVKEEIKDKLTQRAEELGLSGEEFLARIADETTAATEEEVLEFITKAGHPVVALEPMF